MKKTVVIYDKWLHQFGGAEMVACTMADILKKAGWNVILISGKYIHLHKIRDKFGIDLNDTPFYQVWNNENALRKITEGKDLFINLSFMDYSYGYAKRNLYYTHFPTPDRGFIFNTTLSFFHTTGLHVLFPQPYRSKIYNRIRAGIFFNLGKRLASYDIILANSQFTGKWIKKYWNMDSKVLYPPVAEIATDVKLPKKNWICSLGRFFTLGHGKKQEVLIEAFKKFYNTGHGDWELHLMGGVGKESSSIAFAEHLKTLAKGYPVTFHFNADREEIGKVLAQSKVYWHATGYGENEEKNPMAFEHFGIAPVEAISAGCIPILYNGGGLSEIIKILNAPEKNHLFNSVKELVTLTKQTIASKPEEKITISHKNLEENFSTKAFKKRFLELIA